MHSTRYTFDEIAMKGRRVWKDPTTGKRRTQVVKFFQTVNPFNKNAAGFPKTRAEIYKELGAEFHAWVAAAPEGEKREQWA
jgi:hypothetical protein